MFPQGFFQIYERGNPPADNVGYRSLAKASAVWLEAPESKELVQVDASGNVLRGYTAAECRESIRRARPRIRR